MRVSLFHLASPAPPQLSPPTFFQILLETCKEFGVPFSHHSFPQMYWEMLQTFTSPRELGAEVMLYSGG